MVAYSFQARFRAPILAGTKCQTIRAPRRRHAMVGEELQLYTGMRTKYCALVSRARCSAVHPVVMDLAGATIWFPLRCEAIEYQEEVAAFAVRDGFLDWQDLQRFWREEHPGVTQFEGVLIEWTPIAEAVAAQLDAAA